MQLSRNNVLIVMHFDMDPTTYATQTWRGRIGKYKQWKSYKYKYNFSAASGSGKPTNAAFPTLMTVETLHL